MFARALLLPLVLLFAACANQPEIRTDFDKSADFSRYRTFAFVERLGTDVAGYSTLTTQRIRAAVERELTARGYTPSAVGNADLLVNFQGNIKEKERVTELPLPMGYYGYRAGVYAPWAGYPATVDVERYSEGTLNIDLVDRNRRQMVWEGVAVARVTESMREAPEQAIDKAVTEIFAKYPYRAGQR